MVVSNHYGHGYIQRPYAYGRAEFVHRTYYVNGVAYARIYRPYTYRNIALNVYVPRVYYPAGFYGWAYNPWVAPVVYPWGWVGNPWYAYYGPYFAPYPSYANASLWLTDYLVAQTLQAAYQERAAELANAAPANFTPMTPEVKQAISDEVRRQVALENSESAAGPQTPPDPGSSGIARMFADNSQHVFVVDQALDVESAAGECPITQGDVLQLSPGAPPTQTYANLVVLASKGQDCRQGENVSVGMADLQDMQNHMRETIDQGLGELQKNQGRSGLPLIPAAAAAPPVETAYAAIAPPPDPNVAGELKQQSTEADQAEQEALNETESGSPGGAPAPASAAALQPAPAPKELSLGLTLDQVAAIQGQPKEKVDLGAKKIYVYDYLKITFTNGKVTDIK